MFIYFILHLQNKNTEAKRRRVVFAVTMPSTDFNRQSFAQHAKRFISHTKRDQLHQRARSRARSQKVIESARIVDIKSA